MSSLRDLPLRVSYHKGRDNLSDDFYKPCMSRAVRYDRAVAYFRSSIYIVAWHSLVQFVKNGGHIRVVCSPALSPADVAAIESGYTRRTPAEFDKELCQEIEGLLANPIFSDATRVLGALVANGILDLKIALIQDRSACVDTSRLFHSKIGLFYDKDGDCVAFKGSMNESWNGLSNDGNIETVDVFVNWLSGRDAERVGDSEVYFTELWENRSSGMQVQPFPEIAKDLLVRAAAENWPEIVEKISRDIEKPGRAAPSAKKIFPHQEQALQSWEAQGRRGIFEHATGSGKTFTAICAIHDALNRHEKPLIVVPSQLLLKQWDKELRLAYPDRQVEILCCGAGNVKWRTDELLGVWTRPSQKKRCVVTTCATASSDEFRSRINGGEHVFVVADEVHRLGSEEYRQIMTISSGPRLGLSATPKRAGDPQGTQAVLDYFGAVVQPSYTLQDAIADGRLTPYAYRVHTVELTDDEHERWTSLTDRIKRLAGRNHSSPSDDVSGQLKFALIERSRIVKSASRKAALAADVLEQQFREGDRWIVYCDSQVQLRDVMASVAAKGMTAIEYHSAMKGDAASSLRYFEDHGGIVVSIRCLDEGIDMPSVSHALIVASSSNPREFIQRRGRVLRRFPGKSLAYVHDVVVLPRIIDNEVEGASILLSEMSRAIEFGKSAMNPMATAELESIAARFNISFSEFSDGGVEDEQSEGD